MTDLPLSSPTIDCVVYESVMIGVRDGVKLATDIYRPAFRGKLIEAAFPVILERTPYGRHRASRSEVDRGQSKAQTRAEVAEFFVREGYVVIYQDCRGRHDSEGEFVKYLSDGEDGFDTVEWIAAQSWCNGKVATMGLSYAAHTQVAMACLAPPALAAMVVDCGGFSNAYRSGIRSGGAFEMKQVTWAFNQAKQSPLAQNDPRVREALGSEDLVQWFSHMPWKRGQSPVSWAPEYEDYLFEQWGQGKMSDYWQQLGIYAQGWYERFAHVPQIHMSSWYDAYVRTALDNYNGLKTEKKDRVHLIMGPWTHGDRSKSWSGDVDFGEAAFLDGNLAKNWRQFRLSWFDRWLKGQFNAGSGIAPVHLFVMGGGSGRQNPQGRLDHGGQWIEANDWPLPETKCVDFYLHKGGSLSLQSPNEVDASISYVYDPRDPVPTIGGPLTSGEPVFVGGAFDQRESEKFFGCKSPGMPLSARADVLVFETAPLEEDLVVVGPITVCLYVSSDCPDTDFTAKLIDLYPPSADYPRGYAMNLCDGIFRARYHESWEHPKNLVPGKVYTICIEPFATANRFKVGHRLRLDISSSNFPRYDINWNTGEAEAEGVAWRLAYNSVQLNKNFSSHLQLRVLPEPSIRYMKSFV